MICLVNWKSVKKVCSSFISRFKLRSLALVAVLSAGVLAVNSGKAHAALDLTGVAVDTAPVFAIGLIVITGLAAIWAINKTISLIRSR